MSKYVEVEFFFFGTVLQANFVLSIFQVNALLCSLDIDGDANSKGPLPARFRELEGYWNESQAMQKPGAHATDGWVTEFSQHRVDRGDPNAWAHSFEQQHGANGWASEFEQVK